MKIKSMFLENFRKFKGKYRVDFSTDPARNVTIIMGNNGAGKTTFAQAFLWCLYGKTFFKNQEVINREARDFDLQRQGCTVTVELELSHEGKEYTISRKQYYFKGERPKQDFRVLTRNANGDWGGALNEIASTALVKSILPYEISRFFFFDGERLDRMSNELLEKKKSKDFKDAVQGLVGMRPIHDAIEHFGDRSRKTSVIGKINQEISADANLTIQSIEEELDRIERTLEKENEHYRQADEERSRYEKVIGEVTQALQDMQSDIENRNRYERQRRQAEQLERRAQTGKGNLFRAFVKSGGDFFLQPILEEALVELKDADQLEKGIPHIQADTIRCILERHRCICGAPLAHDEEKIRCLKELLAVVPPNSIAQMVGQFAREARQHAKQGEGFFEAFQQQIISIRNDEQEADRARNEMKLLEDRLSNKEKVAELQRRRDDADRRSKACKREAETAHARVLAERERKNTLETKRLTMLSQNERNLKSLRYLQYAEEVGRQLRENYTKKEQSTRERLEKTINHIFERIYDGGIQLFVSDDYLIQTLITDTLAHTKKDDLEQNTGENYAVIFAFISGIIELAKQPDAFGSKEEMHISKEGYPLVMDAPLSSFDKERIGRICEAMPKIAEQVIIIIKDTDGEIAENYLEDRIGKKWALTAQNMTHSTIERRA